MLDAAVGASRRRATRVSAALAAGRTDRKVVTPRLYIRMDRRLFSIWRECGSKVIVAVNTKKDAPIIRSRTMDASRTLHPVPL